MIAVPEGLRADGAAGPPAVVMFWIRQGYETNEAKGIGTGTKIIDASRTPYICEEVSSEAGNADQLAGLGRGQNTIHRHATGCGPNNEDATKSTTATDSSNKITDGSASASVVYHSRGVHVTESKESTKLSIDLPGVKANDVQVVLENGKLHVKAERKAGKQVTFHRELPIDDSVIESSMANLVDGVLTISLTKKQSPESVSVAVASEYPPESPTEENVHFSLDLPGVKSSDLKVTRLSGNIAIEGERKNGKNSSTVKRSYEVDTKTVDVDSIRAFLADGVLTFVAPRKEGPPALTIPVSTLIENSTSEPPKKQAKLDIESSETAPKQSVIPEIEDDKTKPSSGSNEKEWEHVVETVPDEGVKA